MTTLNMMEDLAFMAEEWQLEQSLGLTLFDDPWKTVDFESTDLKTSGSTGNHDLDKLLGTPQTDLADPFGEQWMESADLAEMLQSLVKDSNDLIDMSTASGDQSLEDQTVVSEIKGHDILHTLIEQGLKDEVPVSPEAQVAPTIDLTPETSFNTDMDTSVSTIQLTDMDDIMHSPLSADDVESLLSGSEPSSPQSSVADSTCSELQAMLLDNTSKLNVKTKTRAAPYSKSGRSSKSSKTKDVSDIPVEFLSKKDKKKLQNKNAAIRYRQKKKEEAGMVKSEEMILEKKNKELLDKIDDLSREIQYMKSLMKDVYKAKGVIKA